MSDQGDNKSAIISISDLTQDKYIRQRGKSALSSHGSNHNENSFMMSNKLSSGRSTGRPALDHAFENRQWKLLLH